MPREPFVLFQRLQRHARKTREDGTRTETQPAVSYGQPQDIRNGVFHDNTGVDLEGFSTEGPAPWGP